MFCISDIIEFSLFFIYIRVQVIFSLIFNFFTLRDDDIVQRLCYVFSFWFVGWISCTWCKYLQKFDRENKLSF